MLELCFAFRVGPFYVPAELKTELRLIACQTEALFESEKSYIRQPSISLYDWQESRKRYPTLVSIDNSGDEGPMFRGLAIYPDPRPIGSVSGPPKLVKMPRTLRLQTQKKKRES